MTRPVKLPSGAYELREFTGTWDEWELELERYGDTAGRDRYEVARDTARACNRTTPTTRIHGQSLGCAPYATVTLLGRW